MQMMKTVMMGCLSTGLIFAACSPGGGEGNVGQEDTVPHAVSSDVDMAKVVRQDTVPHAMLPDNVAPTAYRLHMMIDPDNDGFSGVVEIDVEIKKPTDKIWLHGKHMTVTDATAILPGGGSVPLTFTEMPHDVAPSGVANLTSETVLPAGAATLSIPYETPYNFALNSAYKVERDGEAYIVTQFEPLGAREAFPSFDEPRFKVPFTLSIASPNEDVVYSNTPKASTEDLGNGWTKHVFTKSRPLPTYLIAFGSGPYDVVEWEDLPPTEVRERPIKLRGLTAKGKGERIKYGLKNTAGILEAIEGYFGIPYPYEKLDLIAAPDYAFGAMENPGAIVYREYLMLLDEDSSAGQKRSYAGVHSHELAHQWFGNLVTPYWWEDIWLNEAFATWMGNKGTDLWKPEGNFDRRTLNASLGAMNIDTLSTTRKIREPLKRSENVMDQFDGITYRKGGGVLDMFESYVGHDAFQAGVRLHMDRYADGVATADDFFKSIADGSGSPDVVDAMKSFVDQPGLPLVKVSMTCKEGYTEINLSQSRYAPLGSKTKQGQVWQIPVCSKLGGDSVDSKVCELIKTREDVSSLTLETCPAFIMPNENGAGYYRFSLDTEGWNALLANIDQLNAREVLAMQDSLFAAYRAGQVDSTVMIKAMEIFAHHPEYDVAGKSDDLLGFMGRNVPEDTKPALADLVQDMYAQRYQDNVGKDTIDGRLLVPDLAHNLIRYGGDTAMRDAYAAKGAAYLGLDGEPDKKAVAPNLLSRALRTVMTQRPDASYAPLMDMVKDGNSFEKGAALGALGQTPDMEMARYLREALLTDTDTFTGRQATSLLSVLMSKPQHRAATWDWLKDNFEPFVLARVPDVRLGGVPGFADRFCSAERRDEVEAFFEANAAVIPGYERSLAQTLERIELCAALKEAKADEMVEALKARQ